jgi:hypothetical protein
MAERKEPNVFRYLLPVRITVLTSSMPSDVKACGDMLGSPTKHERMCTFNVDIEFLLHYLALRPT